MVEGTGTVKVQNSSSVTISITGRCSAIPRKARLLESSYCNSYLGSQTPSLQMDPPFLLSPGLSAEMTSCGLKYPLGHLGSAVLEVSPPSSLLSHTPCAPPAHSLVGEP